MSQVIRTQYRATLKASADETQIEEYINLCKKRAQQLYDSNKILTCAMCEYKQMLFLYLEYIVEDQITIREIEADAIPNYIFAKESDGELKSQQLQSGVLDSLTKSGCDEIPDILEEWPEFQGKKYWVPMCPVFWTDEPVNVEQWKRKERPDDRCGRIALLYPDKLFSYVCHHQALVKEGLLVGDRYQFISLHENILFSYFETPRDRERVNIKRSSQKSEEIKNWDAVDPNSHFYHFPEANGQNFLIIKTLFSIG